MRRANLLGLAWLAALLAIAAATSSAADEGASPAPARRIYVPFEDLEAILSGPTRRVFVSQEEFERLLAEARTAPRRRPPREAAILSAEHHVTLEPGRAVIAGKLVVEALAEGLVALPLPMSEVSLLSAELEGKPAMLGRSDQGEVTLFFRGPARSELSLRMTARLTTAAAQQQTAFQLPPSGASRLTLAAPGNVELKSGAQVVSSRYDEAAETTRFELLPPQGRVELVLSLNNRQRRAEQVAVARSVTIAELTRAAERLHATFSIQALQGAVEELRLAAPEGMEVAEVVSPLVSGWSVDEEGERRVVRVRLREPATESFVVSLLAVRGSPDLSDWTMPKFEPLGMASHAAVAGLVLEDRLRIATLDAQATIPVDTEAVASAMAARAGDALSPAVYSAAAFYAPQGDYAVRARLAELPVQVKTKATVAMTLRRERIEAQGGFSLVPAVEKLFGFQFTAPAGWEVSKVFLADGQPLEFSADPSDDGGSLVRARLPKAAAAGESVLAYFQAASTPEGWLGDWSAMSVPLPVFTVQDAELEGGAVAVTVADDFEVRAERLDGLIPLDREELSEAGLAGVQAALAFRYDQPPQDAALEVIRSEPRITARAISQFEIRPGVLSAHYELFYDIRQASVQRLEFSLPASTPADVTVRGIGEAEVKEQSATVEGDLRRWTVLLASRRQGQAHLAVDFEQRLSESALDALQLPLPRVEQAAYQSGVVSIEGDAELEIALESHPPPTDVGELADAERQPGRRLLGVFGYTGEAPQVRVSAQPRSTRDLPQTIVEQARLTTVLSIGGRSQHEAVYQLRTRAQFLEARLPAEAALWSAVFDGRPLRPQRDGDRLLVSLAQSAAAASTSDRRELRLVYETPAARIDWRGQVEAQAAKLFERDGAAEREAPVADLVWTIRLPSGYRVVDTEGSVFESAPPERPSPLVAFARWGAELGGGIDWMNRRKFEYAYEATTTTGDVWAPAASEAQEAASSPAFREMGDSYGMDDMGEDGAYARPNTETFAPDVEFETEMDMGARRSGVARSRQLPAPRAQPPADAAPAPQEPSQPPLAAPQPRRPDLHGARSLAIQFDTAGVSPQQIVTLRSLGEDPRVVVTLIHERRMQHLAWGVAILVFALGVAMLASTRRAPKRLLAVTLAVSLAMIAAGWGAHWGGLFERMFVAAALVAILSVALFTYRAVAAGVASVGRRWRARWRRQGTTTTAATVALWLALSAAAHAQAPGDALRDALAPLVAPPPVNVPDDAVVVPYDLDDFPQVKPADKLLVPYDLYLDLMQRAEPDKRRIAAAPPASHALSAAAFQARLESGELLKVQGELTIEVFVDEPVLVRLPLEGGVLTQATLDGKPAQLQSGDSPAESARMQKGAPPSQPQAMGLRVAGKGSHRLTLAARFPLERRGGWRVAQGRLPAGAAASLRLTAPEPRTEVRVGAGEAQRELQTDKPDFVVETALDSAGRFHLEWRPQVAAAESQRGLTAQSEAVLDVREDELRLAWQIELSFPRGEHDRFTLRTPDEWLVESVTGDNVRGWQADEEAPQRLEVTLLRAARDRELIALRLVQRSALSLEGASSLKAPFVEVSGAALHQGVLLVRRSPLLDLRIGPMQRISRIDAGESLPMSAPPDDSPLGLKVFGAFRFVAVPFDLELAAAPVPAEIAATIRTILRLAERQTRLESQVHLAIQGRPVFHLPIRLPEGFEPEEVAAPVEHTWAVTGEEGAKTLHLRLPRGHVGALAIVVRGDLPRPEEDAATPLPRLFVANATRQQGQIVVQSDPAFDVRAEDLQALQPLLLSQVADWLAPEQRPLARLALGWRSTDYSGAARLVPRTPQVSARAITNVRFTDRAIEETILLEFTIREAGIRSVSFRLPARLAGARVQSPLLRQKTVTPIAAEDDAGPPMVQVRLDLHDEVMGQLRALVEHDGPLVRQGYEAPVPIVETGRTLRRYIAVENAGPDELVTSASERVEPLTRQQAEWRELASLLGEAGLTEAHVIRGEGSASLSLEVKERAAVETVAARIGLAKTTLILDAAGAYRAEQAYWIDNRTEQHLDVELPPGGRLWTAQVAGEPAKPGRVAGTSDQLIRIPLVKTAEGDRDFIVSLKYGGKLPKPTTLGRTRFPLPRAVNIQVEQSQVVLHLPDEFRWTLFDGSLERAASLQALEAGYLSYQSLQIERLLGVFRDEKASDYSKTRASYNLKQLKSSLESLSGGGGAEGARTYAANQALLSEAERAIEQDQSQQAQEELSIDNRARLNTLWHEQDNQRAKQVVDRLSRNFDGVAPDEAEEGFASKAAEGQALRRDWLQQNRLEDKSLEDRRETAEKRVDEAERAKDAPLTAPPAKPQSAGAPQIASQLDKKLAAEDAAPQAPGGDRRERLQRYQERLEQQAKELPPGEQAQQMPGMGMGGFGGGGAYDDRLGVLQAGAQLQGQAAAAPAPGEPPAAAAPRGLASLEVVLPQRGEPHYFHTPRGDLELTAVPVNAELLQSAARLAVIAAAALVLWLNVRLLAGAWGSRRQGAAAGGLLLAEGLLALALGALPIFAALAVLAGLAILVSAVRRPVSGGAA